MTSRQILAKTIAGEITLAKQPSTILKKWRALFGIKQAALAAKMQVTPSVISYYENSRRKSPGTPFIRKYVEKLIELDEECGGQITTDLSEKGSDAILDIRELLTPIKANHLAKTLRCEMIVNNKLLDKELDGYTVVDSIKAILSMSDRELGQIHGANAKRALIFTKVTYGRSPLVAVKVTSPKPAMIVLHGLLPKDVDKLAKHIAEIEGIPLGVSKIKTEEEIVKRLRKKIQ